MARSNLWFTRRGNEVRGPFPAGMITRHILLGRILDTDELSHNQFDWQPVTEFDDLYPVELTLDQSIPENRERLDIARMREDERQTGDRRGPLNRKNDDKYQHLRSGDERRETETEEIVRHRAVKTGFRKLLGKPKQRYDSVIALVVILVATILWAGMQFTPDRSVVVNNCSTEPGRHVNWSNCRLEGIQLATVDMTGSEFRSSIINGADFRGAILVSSEFSYANLSNAILEDANLSHVNMVGATLRNTNLSGAKLNSANLDYAILHNANLGNADLRKADFTHAMLNGAVLDGADLSGAIFDKAIWIDNTVCATGSVGRCIPVQEKSE